MLAAIFLYRLEEARAEHAARRHYWWEAACCIALAVRRLMWEQ
jgi:hypothetical protein